MNFNKMKVLIIISGLGILLSGCNLIPLFNIYNDEEINNEGNNGPGDQTPVADPGIEQIVSTGTLVSLNGAGSSDPQGDSLYYSWTIESSPSGSDVQLSDSTAVSPQFTAKKDGLYTFQLIVNDGSNYSTSSTVDITAQSDSIIIGSALKKLIYDDINEKIYGIDSVNKKVFIVDIASKTVESETSLTYIPNDLCFDSTAGRLFIVNKGSSFISEFDISTKTVVANIAWNGPMYDDKDYINYHIYINNQILYIIDAQWSPSLWTINLSDTSIINSYTASIKNIGDLIFTEDGSGFYSWYQYGWSAGSAGSDVLRYSVSGEVISEIDDSNIGYPGMRRDPLDSPLFLDEAGNRIISKTFILNSANLTQTEYTFPGNEEIYAADFTNNIAASKNYFYELTTYNPTEVVPLNDIHQMFFDDAGTLFMLVNSKSAIFYK